MFALMLTEIWELYLHRALKSEFLKYSLDCLYINVKKHFFKNLSQTLWIVKDSAIEPIK